MLIRISCLLLLFCACQWAPKNKAPQSSSFSGTAMVMQYRVVVGEFLKNKERQKVEKIIAKTFKEINNTYNVWNVNSEINQINSMRAGTRHKLSPGLEKLLLETEELVEITGGRFDPTVYPMQKLWKEHLQKKEIPSEKAIQELEPAIGWKNVHIEHGTIYKDHSLTAMDLGGIAKGLCVDMMVENLSRAGYKNVYVEWGGEIRASGKHPSNRPWRVFISRLGDTSQENAVATIPLVDQAVATSGDYIQYWVVEQEEASKSEATIYFHIIDPQTKKPLQVSVDSIASATVKAPNCALADALATAAMMFPTAAEARLWAQDLQERLPATSFWIVTRNTQDSDETPSL